MFLLDTLNNEAYNIFIDNNEIKNAEVFDYIRKLNSLLMKNPHILLNEKVLSILNAIFSQMKLKNISRFKNDLQFESHVCAYSVKPSKDIKRLLDSMKSDLYEISSSDDQAKDNMIIFNQDSNIINNNIKQQLVDLHKKILITKKIFNQREKNIDDMHKLMKYQQEQMESYNPIIAKKAETIYFKATEIRSKDHKMRSGMKNFGIRE